VTLLAASSKLSGSARRWYDIQTGAAVESWTGFRDELIKIFDQKVPFFKTMQRIEGRKWLSGKETFDEYAIDKLALMHRADLVEIDKIHLLISGITQSSLRGIALSVNAATVDAFMESMRRITHGVAEQDKKPMAANTTAKPKDNTCRNCGRKGHGHKDCKGEVNCFYCKEKGHRRFDCPLLKKKDAKGQRQPGTSAVTAEVSEAVAAGVAEDHSPANVVAVVQEGPRQLVINDPLVCVDSLLGERRELTALIDTGSPVSFAKNSVYRDYVKPARVRLNPSYRMLRNLSNQTLEICGTVTVQISLRRIPGINFSITSFVLENDSFKQI